ncbi:hypothetical protein Tco_0983247 [Tanacetum coccineum]
MFRATLKLPMETLEQPFIPPASLEYIQPFLKIVGYQGLVDKVSDFFTKKISHPRQRMFKVFNRYLTSRLIGQDQTKINILQIFHAVVHEVHVDYASLLWWDFIHYVKQKKNVIQKYHVIKDDTPLVNVYTTGKVTVKGMLIPDDLLTDAIRDTQAYKDYEEKYGVKKNRKGTPTAGETSSLRKSLKIRFKNGTRIEPVSHKDNSEEVDDDDETKDDEKDDDDNDDDDHALIRTRKLGSLQIRTKKMQTPTSSPPRSIWKDLSLNKSIDKELLVSITPTPSNSSQR